MNYGGHRNLQGNVNSFGSMGTLAVGGGQGASAGAESLHDIIVPYGIAALYSTRLVVDGYSGALLTTTGDNHFPDGNGEVTGAAVDAGSSNNVEAWRDQSDNGVDLVAVTGWGKPTAGSATVMGTNDRLGIYFFSGNTVAPHAGNSFLRNTSNPFAALTECAIFAVIKLDFDPIVPNDVLTGLWKIGADTNGDNHPFHLNGGAVGDGLCYNAAGSTTRQSFEPGIHLDDPHVFTVVSKASDWIAWLNGVQKHAPGSNMVGFSSEFWLGRSHNPSGTFNHGCRLKIMELIILESEPSADDRDFIIANQADWAGGITV